MQKANRHTQKNIIKIFRIENLFGLDVEGYIKDLIQESNWRNVIVLIVCNYKGGGVLKY